MLTTKFIVNIKQYGTGFIVEKGNESFLVTCKHITEKFQSQDIVLRNHKNEETIVHIDDEILSHDNYDLSLIPISKKGYSDIAIPIHIDFLSKDNPPSPYDGLQVEVIGYTKSYKKAKKISKGLPIDELEFHNSDDIFQIKYSYLGFESQKEGYFYLECIDLCNHGLSGSPVILSDKIIGMQVGFENWQDLKGKVKKDMFRSKFLSSKFIFDII